eukprot:4955676-Alexandrium_andersonii.AAC.1
MRRQFIARRAALDRRRHRAPRKRKGLVRPAYGFSPRSRFNSGQLECSKPPCGRRCFLPDMRLKEN